MLVPSGLSGYLDIRREEITTFYSDAAAKVEITAEQDSGTFYVRVAKPPIRENLRNIGINVSNVRGPADVAVQPTGPAATQGIVQMTVAANQSLRLTDTLELDYYGSDSFSIEVDHGPIQNMTAVEIIVPID